MFVGPLYRTIDLWKNLKRRECPQDYMVERPAKSREARVRFPVPRKRDSSEKLSCNRLSRRFQNDFEWRMQMGIHWQPADSNSARPAARPVENSHQSLSPFCKFRDECRSNYILSRWSPVRIRPPVNNDRSSSVVEQRKNVSPILAVALFGRLKRMKISARMPLELHRSRVRLPSVSMNEAVAQW